MIGLGFRLGLRQKLLLAFSGLFLLLVAVAALSMVVIDRVSHSFETIFHENLETIRACQDMRISLERMNESLLAALWETAGAESGPVEESIKEFERALRFQQGNITVTEEKSLT